MNTEIIRIDRNAMDMDKLRRAADMLRNGGLVAFPTETVYGLGANALDADAVSRIFGAKGRPQDNPLIVHVADRRDVSGLVSGMPGAAQILMDAFWPGPLTLVMRKSTAVPLAVTAGLDTVAVRMPSHPVALKLIREAGVPVAAPSANLSGKPSPTDAQHVIDDLYGHVDAILDSGPTDVGLESTVLDLASRKPSILRPGGVTYEQLADILGSMDKNETREACTVPRSPGMKYRHYSPKAGMLVVEGPVPAVVAYICEAEKEQRSKGVKVGVLATDETKPLYGGCLAISAGSRECLKTVAQSFFRVLREFDGCGVDFILAEGIGDAGIGAAIMNRMRKAAGGNVVRL